MTDHETALVGKIAEQLTHLGTGPLALLRRMDPTCQVPAPGPLHRLLVEHPDEARYGNGFAHWQLLVHLLALAAPDGHRGGSSLGAALQRGKYSEARLMWLLEAEADAYTVVLPRMVRFLVAKEEPLPQFELADLVLWRGSDRSKHRISQDYYRAEREAEKEAE